MKALKILLPALGVALLAYLLLWPTGMDPVSWQPPPAPPLEGVYAENDKLKGIERLADGHGDGPEAVFVDDAGRVLTGYADGRLVALSPVDGTLTELADTGGRPLGITRGPLGGIVVADAKAGLLLVRNGKVEVLSTEANEVPFGFTDDADYSLSDPGHIYFTDASSKFGYGLHMKDILEHGPNGRLLRFNVATGKTEVLLDGLHFANGVAVGPNGDFVLVNETASYRVMRYWLKGEKAGTHDVFIDNLPGFPDNITFNGGDRFWVALFAPRNPLLDSMLPGGGLMRKISARLPALLQPQPEKRSFALGLDLDGKVVANLQYKSPEAFAPITSVREHGNWLYFGSLTDTAIGRLPLRSAIVDR